MCHDASSLLAVHFPYAAPRPASCSAKFVVTPLTTLLTYANGLTPATLLEALNLPTTFDVLTVDSLAVRHRAWGGRARRERGRHQHPPRTRQHHHLPCSHATFPTAATAPAPGPQAATVGNADAKRVYRREAQLQQVVLVGAKFLTKNTATLGAARTAMLQSLAAQVAPAAAGRRLLADATVQSLGKRGTACVLCTGAWPHAHAWDGCRLPHA